MEEAPHRSPQRYLHYFRSIICTNVLFVKATIQSESQCVVAKPFGNTSIQCPKPRTHAPPQHASQGVSTKRDMLAASLKFGFPHLQQAVEEGDIFSFVILDVRKFFYCSIELTFRMAAMLMNPFIFLLEFCKLFFSTMFSFIYSQSAFD